MKRLISCLLLLSGIGWSQTTGQNVVTLPLVQNATIVGNTTYTCNSSTPTVNCASVAGSSLQNIGQSSHSLLVHVVGATGFYSIHGDIEGSINGTTWFNIGSPVTQTLVSSQTDTLISGFQSYPWLRVVVTVNVLANTSLVVSLTYVGNSTPSHNLIDVISSDSSMSNLFGSGIGDTAPFGLVGAGTGNQVSSLYGFIIGVPATITNILIGCSSDGTVAGIALKGLNIPISTAQTIILPMSLRAYLTCPPTYAMIGQVTGTGSYSWTAQFRGE